MPVSISEHPLPLPLGEVAERSEDGEGKPGCKTLSVTYGDSSPKGRAKRGVPRYIERVDTKMERIRTDALHSLFYDYPFNGPRVFVHFFLRRRRTGIHRSICI